MVYREAGVSPSAAVSSLVILRDNAFPKANRFAKLRGVRIST